MSTARAPHRPPHRPPRRAGPAESARALRVVRLEPPPRRQLSPAACVALAGLLLVALLGLAGSHALLVQGQMRLDRLSEQLASEQDRHKELRLRVAELESPARAVEAARARLGMVTPQDVVYLDPLAPPGAAPPAAANEPVGGPGVDAWAEVKPLLEPLR